MKVLLVNNFLNNSLGGVENYLEALVLYAKENKTNIIFKWFGVAEKKTKIYQKFYNAQTTEAIIKEIETFQPDLIHCFSIGATVTPQFMSYAKRKSIPIIQSFRDYYYICPKGSMLDVKGKTIQEHKSFIDCMLHHHPKKNLLYDSLLYYKQSFHKKIIKENISYFLTPSNNLTKLIKHTFNVGGETLPNPVLISNLLLEQNESNYLLFVGRLEPEKGVLTLLKAFQKILKKFPDEQLKIVGSGSIQNELEKFVAYNKIENVCFLGSKNREELMYLYAAAKFTIVPSEFLESYGNVILESFAFKKTVIISNLLGIQDEIIRSKSGLVFPYGDVEKLQEAIEKLLTNPEFKKELEVNASSYIKELTFQKHFQKLEIIYNRVLKSNKTIS
ncbi:glycosyltransferase involved in cell wall biosynthesis [Flavobacterium sp. PL11]|uniref:glycosyltransferase family 4 protein n=1 Tax=Flavobacterium sp. PL11 TaxID=3071717 RepID=UPI002E04BBEC|nr:glycosyltransferase involved in cell wall biosynthesis [Flavobacterium sp. PL11]